MNTKIASIIIVFGILSQVGFAQDYAFRVLVNKGENKVKTVDAKWKPLKTGAKLKEGDKVKLVSNSYMGLVHNSGKTLELKEDAIYDIALLSEKLRESSKSVVSKYADFVISKMAPEVIESNRRKYASVTGSGERGLYDTDIHLYAPKTAKLLNSNAIITWVHKGENKNYIISIKNILGDQILKMETSSTSYALNFKNKKIAEGAIMNIIIVRVYLKSDPSVISQEIAISLLDGEERQELEDSLLELVASLGGNSALNNLILAAFYEEKGLILDAIASYENALVLLPKISYFQESYDEFLIRNQLKEPFDNSFLLKNKGGSE